MEYVLLILSFILVLTGILGSFLPVLPGPSLSWLGMLLLYFVDGVSINLYFLIATLILVVVVSLLDYVIPSRGTKKYGGSKYGIWGTNIGLVVGIFTPIPLGFIAGPFIGAFIGELINNQKEVGKAFKAATGSFIGFLASTFIKFVLAMGILGWYIVEIYNHRDIWF